MFQRLEALRQILARSALVGALASHGLRGNLKMSLVVRTRMAAGGPIAVVSIQSAGAGIAVAEAVVLIGARLILVVALKTGRPIHVRRHHPGLARAGSARSSMLVLAMLVLVLLLMVLLVMVMHR